MRVPLRHRSTREHADDARDLRDGPVSRALAVNGEDRDGDDADHARDERAIPSHAYGLHGADSGAASLGTSASGAAVRGAEAGADAGAGASLRSQVVVTRAPATRTVAEMPTSGRPCASGSSTEMEPTGVTHSHGRMPELDDGTDEGAETGGRCAPEHAPQRRAAKERREVMVAPGAICCGHREERSRASHEGRGRRRRAA